MRRKSHRNATKASPEKPAETVSRRSRRHSKRHKRSSSRSSTEDSDDVSLKKVAERSSATALEEKQKSEEIVPQENAEQPVWKVTPACETPSGEIQKIKLCLTRPIAPPSPEKPERSSRRRRNKSGSQGDDDVASPDEKVSSRKLRLRSSPAVVVEDQEEEPEEQEEKKGKGKSKSKNRSKSDKTPQIQEVQDQTQSEISENVQVTPQSPQATIDIRVDNESVSTIEHETVTTIEHETVTTIEHETVTTDETETNSIPQNTNTSDICDVTSGSDAVVDKQTESNHKHITPPQSPVPQHDSDSTKEPESFDSQGNFKGFSAPEQSVEEQTCVEQQDAKSVAEETVLIQNQSEIEKTEEQMDIEQKQSDENKDQGVEETLKESEDSGSQVQENVQIPEFHVGHIEIVDTEIQDSSTEAQEPERKQEENMDVDENQSADTTKADEEQTAEITDPVEESHHLPTRESKSESVSSEEAEPANQEQDASPTNKQVEQPAESQSPADGKDIIDESNSKSAEETHRFDEDSRSVDAIILDNSCTPSKEDSTFNLTQSFSPDIREIVAVNKELQDMRSEMSELLPTPTKPLRKTKWGYSSAGLELIKPSLNKINIETIKELCPELRFLDEGEVKIDVREIKDRRKSYTLDQNERRTERKVSIEFKPDEMDSRKLESQSSVNSEMDEIAEQEVDNSNIIAMNRKISIVDDTASKLKPPPSPAKNPVAEVLYITNLVRPFTLKQLKELLERTGKIRENGFWTDRIKSKCYVHYDTTEEAEATRNALHGVHWPIGNGKKLIIDYATPEDLEKARNPTPPPPVIPEPKIPEKEPQEIEQVPPKRSRTEEREKVVKERERHKTETHVREWDIGKENMHKMRSQSRERDSRNDRNERRRHRRTPSPEDDFIARKQKKKEEDIPQKLMDDLFRKTKATPSIYWLPLTPEEIATKQQQRLLRMAEHKRRMEESSRSRGDYGRGAAYRRRYD